MSDNEKEIPEELFQKDFGGNDFERRKELRRDDKILAMTFNGILFAILGPSVLASVALVIAFYMYWR